ncbi:hypothetical protein [Floricoccus penangensis]|uniref:hypothetical protein n=1 Tax=Floricoccus penangensis TaxID=1859475 RepID=UPI001300E415|nr:hypothetical protein [Floricoccus penangensis]
MNHILEKQFLTDFGIDKVDNKNIFICKEKQQGGRFFTQDVGNIVVHSGKLICRADNQN